MFGSLYRISKEHWNPWVLRSDEVQTVRLTYKSLADSQSVFCCLFSDTLKCFSCCRTIVALVYNVLKTLMEMNCTLFDELTSSYKADRQRWVTHTPTSTFSSHQSVWENKKCCRDVSDWIDGRGSYSDRRYYSSRCVSFFIASSQFEIGFSAGGQMRLFLKLRVIKHPKWPDDTSYKMFPGQRTLQSVMLNVTLHHTLHLVTHCVQNTLHCWRSQRTGGRITQVVFSTRSSTREGTPDVCVWLQTAVLWLFIFWNKLYQGRLHKKDTL